ncbi:Peroxidase [Hypsibius exemplaris]|uniref:Peroxidase n=1 Tax=Hypsibius exemplaris TaxID=2072580 RepID=A0A1W0WUG8_HYPEX|nr:Peroxidase [Hypsibius exemplaris]
MTIFHPFPLFLLVLQCAIALGASVEKDQNTDLSGPPSDPNPKLPKEVSRVNRELLELLEDETTLSSRFPEFSNDFISGLVTNGRHRAEELFGVPLEGESYDDVVDGTENPDFSKSKRDFKEPLIVASQFPVVENGSAAAGLGRFGAMMQRVVPVSQQANVLLDITKGIAESEKLRGKRQFFAVGLRGLAVPQFRSLCPFPKERALVSLADPFNLRTLPQCAHTKYRSMSGFCNNIALPNRGKESTIYRRLLDSNYGDGVAEVRRSVTGQALPGPRLISLTVFDGEESPRYDMSALNAHFGQFVAHDMANSPSSKTADRQTPKCCDTTAQPTHPDCWPIDIPTSDEISAKNGRTCMEFVRTLPGVRPGCTLGAREQINQVTHFLDASTVYGSTDEEALALRTLDGRGELKTVKPIWNFPHFTVMTPDASGCADATGRQCFKGGDQRTNVQPGLTMMHTIWMRNHNRLAEILLAVNPHWNDEQVFQEARRLSIAQLQHIVYNEYIPNFLGSLVMDSFGLSLLKNGRYAGYNITAHPAITSEFAVAGFRLHSTIPPVIALRNMDNSKAGSKLLRNAWFQPFDLYQGEYFVQCTAGMAAGALDKMDHHFTDETRNHLFQTFPSQIGLDLPAIDIQRGRDHGLQPWVKYRELCQLRVPKSFEELKVMDVMPSIVVDRMASIYSSVEDVDLFVAGTAERHVAGGMVGPTFACIIGEQFFKLKSGDRFWYENDLPIPSAFTQRQIDEIRKTSFAQLLCTNVDALEKIQTRVFHAANEHDNPLLLCSSLPDLDFSAWKE